MSKRNALSLCKLAMLNMSVGLIAATASANIDVPRTELDAERANDLGINLIVQNFNYEYMDEPSPLFFKLDLTTFEACQVRDVGMDVWDSAGTLVFGTGISSFFGPIYPFRLGREYLDTTRIGVVCDEGPDDFSHVYQFTLGDLVQFP